MGHGRILGIDQGTTGTRAVVMDASGVVVGEAYRAHTQHRPRDGWVEHDPEEIWQAVCDVSRRALAAAAGAGIMGVGLGNQGETVLLWRRDTAQPLSRALVWQDTRAEPLMAELAADAGFAAEVSARTGLRLDPYFSAGKLRWLLDHVEGARALAERGLLAGGTLDAWLLERLTGRAVTDVSTAARTLLFDIGRLDWDDGLCQRFGVPRAILPELRPSAGELGRVRAPELPGLAGVPVLASLVDQPAALLGQGCLTPGTSKVTYGTGCFVYLNTGATPRPSRHGLLTTVAWQAHGATTYALEGGVFTAGSLLGWLRELGLCTGEAELDRLASQAAGAGGGVVCVPALAGLAAPHWRRDARAAFLGLGLGTTRAELCRAALEGIACRVTEVVRAMEADSGARIEVLRADGGLTASAVLMQLGADLSGLPVEVAAQGEATVMGVCYLAARAAGLWPSDDEIVRRVGTARRYVPALGAAQREARLARFAAARAAVIRFADAG